MYWATSLLLTLLALGYWYLRAGMANETLYVDYSVSVKDPRSGRAQVSMTVEPGNRLCLDLYMRDSRLNGRWRVENLTVTGDGKLLPTWLTVPGFPDLRRFWTAGSEVLTIEYDVDPLWLKGNKPRSYLGEEFGYLRGLALLYTPVTLGDLPAPFGSQSGDGRQSGTASLRFCLPVGWQVNSPWPAGATFDTAALRNVYFGLGRLSLQTIKAGDIEMQLAIYSGLSEAAQVELRHAVPQAFALSRQMLQVDPLSDAPMWAVSIVPDDPIHGGAAGTNSLICSPDLGTLVHEMFHWWNGHTLQYTKDANWIQEGFTTYYEGKLLRRSGYWNDGQLAEYLGKKYSQIPDALSPVNLSQASASFVKTYSRDGYYQVYSGGATVAAWLDRELQPMGRSLDEIWPHLIEQTGQISTEAFLSAVSNLYGNEIAGKCRLIVLGQQPIPSP